MALLFSCNRRGQAVSVLWETLDLNELLWNKSCTEHCYHLLPINGNLWAALQQKSLAFPAFISVESTCTCWGDATLINGRLDFYRGQLQRKERHRVETFHTSKSCWWKCNLQFLSFLHRFRYLVTCSVPYKTSSSLSSDELRLTTWGRLWTPHVIISAGFWHKNPTF